MLYSVAVVEKCVASHHTATTEPLQHATATAVVQLLQCDAHRTTLQQLKHCNTLQHPATPCNTLQHPAAPCNAQPTTTHCKMQPLFISRTAFCESNRNTLQQLNHCNTLQHTTTPCNTSQRTTTHRCSKYSRYSFQRLPPASQNAVLLVCRLRPPVLQCVAVCCSVLQVYCSVLQCVAESKTFSCDASQIASLLVCCPHPLVLQCVAVCCSVLQRVAVCCSVLQCVAVCCSVL